MASKLKQAAWDLALHTSVAERLPHSLPGRAEALGSCG